MNSWEVRKGCVAFSTEGRGEEEEEEEEKRGAKWMCKKRGRKSEKEMKKATAEKLSFTWMLIRI